VADAVGLETGLDFVDQDDVRPQKFCQLRGYADQSARSKAASPDRDSGLMEADSSLTNGNDICVELGVEAAVAVEAPKALRLRCHRARQVTQDIEGVRSLGGQTG